MNATTLIYLAFLLPLGVSLAATPVIIALARRHGWVVEPREDRWHRKPTAVFGGVGIYLAFTSALLVLGWPLNPHEWALLACGTAMFLLGLADDILDLKPQVKFLGQVLIATVAVVLGIRLEIIPWPWLSVLFTVFWLVGVTNALNILDNMDGLSSGVTFVAGTALALAGWLAGQTHTGMAGAMLAGASLGFFFYNFNPAKIFMGDCGSLFLGFILAATTVMGVKGGAGHLFLSLILPLGALVVPIFDTTLVSFQRTSHGRSIAQGGRDHTSHRLVFLGLSEKRAVLVLLAISSICGLGSLFLAHFATPLAAVVVAAVVLVLLVFFGVFLGDVKVYDATAKKPEDRWHSPILGKVILYKKQILQMVADLILFSAAYTAAWLLRFEGHLTPDLVVLLSTSLPLLLGAKMLALWAFGVYKGDWRYISVSDMIRLAKGCFTGSLLFVLLLVVIYRFEWYSRAVIIIDFFLSFLMVAGSRSLIRVFRESIRSRRGVPVLIMGAGDGGELLIRELRNNPGLPYQPVGFVDDDPAKRGQVIHGIRVLGNRQDLPELIQAHQVQRVFISILSQPHNGFEDVFATCRKLDVECTRIQPMIKL
ncbi:MAG: hypothetical protein KQJ78_11845 [Deltaproteobacteria bacterium]|nr:hypothetical protein [Deltaproteobacteria bacterium]